MRLTGQEEAVDVFTVVAKRHVLLAEPDGVFALCDAVKLFELGLGDAAFRKVDIQSICAADGRDEPSPLARQAQKWERRTNADVFGASLRVGHLRGPPALRRFRVDGRRLRRPGHILIEPCEVVAALLGRCGAVRSRHSRCALSIKEVLSKVLQTQERRGGCSVL